MEKRNINEELKTKNPVGGNDLPDLLLCEEVTGQDQNGLVPKEKQPVIDHITVIK